MRRRLIAPAFLIAAVLAFAFSGCFAQDGPGDPEDLAAVEIRQYQGTDLSSITDFRENSISGVQRIDLESYRLRIDGLVSNPRELALDEVTASYPTYRKVVTLNCVEGWWVKILWEGVLVEDLIDDADVSPAANTVIFHASDGYTTSLPLAFVRDQDIMLASEMNGVALPPERGAPFQLVAESKWGYKWIKWVTRIELSDDPSYLGYWESRGYSNDGDI